jgi:thioredoxin reductase
MIYDVIVVGGSFAGLAAALQIARARRQVLVLDSGVCRNRFADRSHGLLTHDGTPPTEILATAREQLLAYPTAHLEEARVEHAEGVDDGFSVTLASGERREAKKLILATGIRDELPPVEGLEERWGKSVFHCPYCHGYELGEGMIGVLALRPASVKQAILLAEWGPVVLFTNGACEPDEAETVHLHARGVVVEREPVEAFVDGETDCATRARLSDGRVIPLAAVFLSPVTAMTNNLAQELGCAFDEDSTGPFIRKNEHLETTVPGVFACGDAARGEGNLSWAVGEGASAGIAAHQSLIFG